MVTTRSCSRLPRWNKDSGAHVPWSWHVLTWPLTVCLDIWFINRRRSWYFPDFPGTWPWLRRRLGALMPLSLILHGQIYECGATAMDPFFSGEISGCSGEEHGLCKCRKGWKSCMSRWANSCHCKSNEVLVGLDMIRNDPGPRHLCGNPSSVQLSRDVAWSAKLDELPPGLRQSPSWRKVTWFSTDLRACSWCESSSVPWAIMGYHGLSWAIMGFRDSGRMKHRL